MRIYMRNWEIGHQGGQYSHMQLWNRHSTRTIYMRELVITPTDSTGICVLRNTSALAHDITQAGAGNDGGLTYDGSDSVVGQLRFHVDPEQSGGQLFVKFAQPLFSMPFPEIDGWEILPGTGLMVRMGSTDVGFFGSWKWEE